MSFIKNIIIVAFLAILFVECSKENQFLIEKGKVGMVTNETKIMDLKTIFAKDSLVADLLENKKNVTSLFTSDNDEYIIYAKDGRKLLEIVPLNQGDSLSTIKSVQIFDANYKTEKGLSLSSTFKDINEHYMINKVESTLTSATLFIDDLNATIAIDKKDLGLNRFGSEEITIEQIPDMAKIKFFTIWLN